MTKITEAKRTDNQVTTNYDFSKLALGNNEFSEGVYTPGGDVTIAEGLVFGKVAATGAIIPCVNTAADGSDIPFGVFYNALNAEKDILSGVATTLTLIKSGDVDGSKLTFGGASVITSVATSIKQQLGDLLSNIGINVITPVQLNKYDN